MSRWDVLVANINPTLQPLDKLTLARYIGERVETSIRRNSTVRVAYEDWWLSKTEKLERLEPNNNKVTAYYIPEADGKPQEVFIFQGDRFIDQVERVETYNRVMAEQTDEDKEKYQVQQKKVASFTKYVKDNAIGKVGVMKSDVPKEEAEETFVLPPPRIEEPDEAYMPDMSIEERALADI